jgi:hypothetical protein
MPLQLRPKDNPMMYYYSPNRDVAHIMPSFMGRAIWGISEANREPWFRDYLKYRNITDEEVCLIAKAAAAYVVRTNEDATLQNSYEALKSVGFFDAPEPAQLVFLAKLGQLFLTYYFQGRREAISQLTDQPFSIPGVQAMVEEAERVIAQRNGALRRQRRGLKQWTLDLFARLKEWWNGKPPG